MSTALRELRERRALTLAEVAMMADLSLGTVWRSEAGRSRPTPKTRRKIAAALNVDPAELVEAGMPKTRDDDGDDLMNHGAP